MSDVTIVKEGWVQKRGKFYLLMKSASDVSYTAYNSTTWLHR